jgi:hypothetical protein
MTTELADYSSFLESTFDIGIPTHCYFYKKAQKDTIDFYIDVYSVELTNKTNADLKYIMYFMIYDLCVFNLVKLYDTTTGDTELKYKHTRYSLSYEQNKKCRYRNRFAPVSIVPANRKINKFGLSDKFISTGNYTCKVLEYNDQSTKYEVDRFKIEDPGYDPNKLLNTTDYSFVGDRYDNLFPFNQIKERHPEILQLHEPKILQLHEPMEYDESGNFDDFFRNVKQPVLTRSTKKWDTNDYNSGISVEELPLPPQLLRTNTNAHLYSGISVEELPLPPQLTRTNTNAHLYSGISVEASPGSPKRKRYDEHDATNKKFAHARSGLGGVKEESEEMDI